MKIYDSIPLRVRNVSDGICPCMFPSILAILRGTIELIRPERYRSCYTVIFFFDDVYVVGSKHVGTNFETVLVYFIE
jgi:hypothetical protein